MPSNVRREVLVAIAGDPNATSLPFDGKTSDLKSLFATHCFDVKVQKERLPENVFESLQETIRNFKQLDPEIAETVAKEMCLWAQDHGATHFSHWFQPMTDSTAEKHDCFVMPESPGVAIAKFSGSELVRGEPDASSFPSGGLRATFEARGYTAWDPSSPAFIFRHKNGATLVIPTLFISWTGDALDMRTPLLRSMMALEQQALRVLKLFGNKKVHHVYPTVGAEQEYFLVDRRLAALRPDLLITGRTLFGAKPPKGQELDDSYCGSIPERVIGFMTELEYEAILLGIPVHTRHNETAPAQFEIAPLFEQANLAVDHQMLLMQLLRNIAARHGFHCLLHEKPFTGINGSAKHNNWSLMTDDGENLLEPGETPHDNAQFLFFISAVLRAVHRHGDLLRMSVSGAGNDHRLGADEAPPAIMSVFLGGALEEVFHKLASGGTAVTKKQPPLEVGVSILPPLKRHSEDRNRTSPFAFTGNKFEFRAVGSSHNVARSTTVLNAIVTESLDYMAGLLEEALESKKDFHAAVHQIVCNAVKEHRAVLFSGNCYSDEWKKEAKKRGLPNLKTTAECLPLINSRKTAELFEKYKIFSKAESESRREIYAENYIKTIRIEADTAVEIASTMILPTVLRYKSILIVSATTKLQKEVLRNLDIQIDSLIDKLSQLKKIIVDISENTEQPMASNELAKNYCNKVLPAMQTLRETVDTLETIVDDDLWPMPTYTEMLFVR
jgi:glutamine synthetase